MHKLTSCPVFKKGPYRFFFFSREEARIHIHVVASDGEAKFWIEPITSLATFDGFSAKQLTKIQTIVEEHKNEIVKAWKAHFGA